MESTRQKKFARMIQRELSTILFREVEQQMACMVTLTDVRVTADLQLARCYVTFFPEEKTKAGLLLLNENNWKIRKLLSAGIKEAVRIMPNLEFYEDDTLKTARRLDALFDKIHAEDAQRQERLAHLPPLEEGPADN